MSKRRRGKQPNLPQSTLDRARQQAGIEETGTNGESSETNGESASVIERAAKRRKLSPVQIERSRQRGELDNDVINDILRNPTDFVSEAQLREEYQHVLVDLRNMGLLSAVLMVLLVALAQFI